MHFKILLSFILSYYTQSSFASFIEVDKESAASHQLVLPNQNSCLEQNKLESFLSQDQRTLQIINVPSEPNISKLEDDEELKLLFIKLMTEISTCGKIDNKYTYSNLRSISLLEAKENFNTYFCNSFGVSIKDMENMYLYKIIFNKENFGSFYDYLLSPLTLKNIIQKSRTFLLDIRDKKYNEISNLPFLLSTAEELSQGYISYHEEKNIQERSFIEDSKKIFVPENIGLPNSQVEIEKYFKKHSIKFFDHQFIQNIYNTAKRILEITKPQDNIVIFGNTPYFVGRALSHIVDLENSNNKRTIIQFPFSGTPNRERNAINNQISYENIVTKERLKHLQTRMEKVGLWPGSKLLDKDTWFVDVYGIGAGVSYFCEELLRNCIKQNEPIPELHVISLNEININNAHDSRNAFISENSVLDGQNINFTFPSLKNPHFKMTGQVVHLPNHDLLDNPPSEEWRAVPDYKPCKWYKEYDAILTQTPPVYLQRLFQYFDIHIKDLINSSIK